MLALDSLYQSLFDAGLQAHRAGQPRAAQPWQGVEVNPSLLEFWRCGWDTGAMAEAYRVGYQSAPRDACPYQDPTLSAAWRRGRFVAADRAANKNPAARGSDARRG